MRLKNNITVKNPILVRERRKALIAAAIKVFSAKGYHASTVSEIARAAGISQGSVYNYINSKADILYLVCSEVYLAFEHMVREAIADAETPMERLSLAIHSSIDATFRLQDHLLLLYQELHCLDRKLWRPFLRDAAKLRQLYQDILNDVAKSERMDFGNPLVAASVILIFPSTLIMRRWDLDGKVSEKETRKTLAMLMCRSLGLPEEMAQLDQANNGAGRHRSDIFEGSQWEAGHARRGRTAVSRSRR
jgi:AcrR family transcriptional regulator